MFHFACRARDGSDERTRSATLAMAGAVERERCRRSEKFQLPSRFSPFAFLASTLSLPSHRTRDAATRFLGFDLAIIVLDEITTKALSRIGGRLLLFQASLLYVFLCFF